MNVTPHNSQFRSWSKGWNARRRCVLHHLRPLPTFAPIFSHDPVGFPRCISNFSASSPMPPQPMPSKSLEKTKVLSAESKGMSFTDRHWKTVAPFVWFPKGSCFWYAHLPIQKSSRSDLTVDLLEDFFCSHGASPILAAFLVGESLPPDTSEYNYILYILHPAHTIAWRNKFDMSLTFVFQVTGRPSWSLS